ncbi:MAG: AzlD domain-containing protein [Chloroflexi bacterium]|nr:MAG: AzlD domain-containing protein [Chloroflexota bacterium]
MECRDGHRHRRRRGDRRSAPPGRRLCDHCDVHWDRGPRDPPPRRFHHRDRRRAGRGRSRARGSVHRRGDHGRRPGTADRGLPPPVIWIAIVGSALATYLTRSLPLALTVGGGVPPVARRYLEALPVAIIAALVGPAVVAPGGTLTRGSEPLAAALVITVVAWRRSLLAGVIAGVVAVALLRLI